MSNEESSTRTFHRTTSAQVRNAAPSGSKASLAPLPQVTLDEANAMLAEFGTDKETAMDTNTDGDEGIQVGTSPALYIFYFILFFPFKISLIISDTL